MKLCPENAEEFIDYLIKNDRLDEAAIKLGDVVNDEKFTSKEGKSKHQLWHDLCDLMTKNPDKVCESAFGLYDCMIGLLVLLCAQNT